MALIDKIKLIITTRQLTPSHFADQIGVQRSSISHILSGRNRASLEIVQRIVTRFPDITYDWLLEPEETDSPLEHYSTNQTPSSHVANPILHEKSERKLKSVYARMPQTHLTSDSILEADALPMATKGKTVEKILIFYNDKTFVEFLPSPSG